MNQNYEETGMKINRKTVKGEKRKKAKPKLPANILRWSNSLDAREMQDKSTVTYLLLSNRK